MGNKELVLREEINLLESKKSKYYLIGFITGLLPYLILSIVCYTLSIDISFIKLLLFIGLLTAVINGYILSNHIFKKLVEFFNLKYDIDYYKIKETI